MNKTTEVAVTAFSDEGQPYACHGLSAECLNSIRYQGLTYHNLIFQVQ
jgi:hypothetical protein